MMTMSAMRKEVFVVLQLGGIVVDGTLAIASYGLLSS
jgi:hypothetical protein